MSSVYFELLTQWCDAMIRQQVSGLGEDFDGGLLCPACKYEHGRCIDAVYPLLYMADRTGDAKYTHAAKKLFDWHVQAVLCDDGSAYNDPNNAWNGTTVFAATAICEALDKHAASLDAETQAKWRDVLSGMAEWLYHTIDEHFPTNINYVATNAAALALCGTYLKREDYISQARHLAAYVLDRITANGFLYGEGKPRESVTPRGCRPIDVGYNVEESIPSLVKYAACLRDESAMRILEDVLRKQLDFLLPDGAWDNSFGSRNNKWTYYGSRTSDGCASAYAIMADRDPMFAEAALRNVRLLRQCSQGGLLRGGPQYALFGEKPCVHHTFTHANAVAAALDAGIEQYDSGTSLPAETCGNVSRHFPEIDTWKIVRGDWHATVTCYDYDIRAGHASGGALTLLWHRRFGPVIAGSVIDYALVEPTNQQLSLRKRRHRTLTPRAELVWEGVRYAQCYDTAASVVCRQQDDATIVEVHSNLVSLAQKQLPSPLHAELEYRFEEGRVRISGRISGSQAAGARFVLPIVSRDIAVNTKAPFFTEDIFFLTGGFGATEYTILPNENGCFALELSPAGKPAVNR